jgi:Domain of unknown function (DUF4034)
MPHPHFHSLLVVLFLPLAMFSQDPPTAADPVTTIPPRNGALRCIAHDAPEPVRSNLDDALNVDASMDIKAVDKYECAVARLLNDEEFDLLDEIASQARSSKSRFLGGKWKLSAFYKGLELPPAADPGWPDHIRKLEDWKSHNPESVTARIAMAVAYTAYGWDARSESTADKVTEEGWRLFAERTAVAAKILKDASALKQKCPHWYAAMLQVALAQGMDPADEESLFQQAIAFEPLYDPYYRARAWFLLPIWYGEEGETEEFADKTANRIGGQEGDILYFEIAAQLACSCNAGFRVKHLSWKRIQAGQAAQQEKYGVSLVKLNWLAKMAERFSDPPVGEKANAQIGENWDEDTWKTRNKFDNFRNWVSNYSVGQKMLVNYNKLVKANLETEEGKQYDVVAASEIPQKLGWFVEQCSSVAGDEHGSFDLLMMVHGDGVVGVTFVEPYDTKVGLCVEQKLMRETMMRNSPVYLSPPPKPNYWVKVSMQFKP